MKKIVPIICVLFLLCSCSSNPSSDYKIDRYKFYINTVDYYSIATYNEYIVTEINETLNQDGSYLISFKIDRAVKTGGGQQQ